MPKDFKEELKQLKKDFLEMERVHEDEKECLLKVINTFSLLASMHTGMEEEVSKVKNLISTDTALSPELIENEIARLKDKIIASECQPAPDGTRAGDSPGLTEKLLESCRVIRKIMFALLEGFYPVKNELAASAENIDMDCNREAAEIDLAGPTDEFLGFIEGLKENISKDFRFINKAFFTLLDNVKGLEKTLSEEFGIEGQLKQIEYFEMKVNHEVVSIADSFNIHKTIDEVKKAVISKIKNIRKLVSLRKKEEIKKARAAQEKIENLRNRINRAERDVSEMSRRAEKFKTEAMNDGLTGLYNRKAFDTRINEALEGFAERGEPFSIILFDVDKFKEINDTFGHVAGDKVLVKIAQCLRETFRKDDFIARYGGDEFVVVIERLTKEMALERITEFKKHLGKLRFTSHAKGDINISVSPGIAPAMDGDTPESIIERADRAMYDMKRNKN